MRKILLRLAAPVIVAFIMFLIPAAAYADTGEAPYYGFGTTNGRTDTVNLNDYHTDSWDRFQFNYQFNSGSDYRYDFGYPTTYEGQVQLNVYNANIRRDKNAVSVPPGYGVFSGNVSTQPSNYLFPKPENPAYWSAYSQADPNITPVYDTLLTGVNAPAEGNQMNMYNVGQSGVMPNTSVGGDDVTPIGANNATGDYTYQNGDWSYQSGSGSSTVSTPTFGEFLPPTSTK